MLSGHFVQCTGLSGKGVWSPPPSATADTCFHLHFLGYGLRVRTFVSGLCGSEAAVHTSFSASAGVKASLTMGISKFTPSSRVPPTPRAKCAFYNP